MMSSGLITDMAAIPVPDFAVPYAAPRAENENQSGYQFGDKIGNVQKITQKTNIIVLPG